MLYNCRLGERVRLVLAPFGARGRDAAYTLNPLTGQVGGCWQQADSWGMEAGMGCGS